MNPTNDMRERVDQARDTVRSITDVFRLAIRLAADEAKAEFALARVEMEMELFGATLEMLNNQREKLLERKASAPKALATAIDRQVEVLALQEASILERLGVPTEVATKAVAIAAGDDEPTHKRDGRRFQRVPATKNGTHSN